MNGRALVTAIATAVSAERSARHAVRRYTERSRLARVAGAIVTVAATAMLARRWLHPPELVPFAVGYAALVAVVEWRRTPPVAKE